MFNIDRVIQYYNLHRVYKQSGRCNFRRAGKKKKKKLTDTNDGKT
jgi:hypothetical protein